MSWRTRLIAGVVIGLSVVPGRVDADVVHDWNAQALRVPFAVGPPQARVLAMVHVAMHDAINSILDQYEPYAIKMDAPAGASPVAAGAVAAHDVLVVLFPSMRDAYDAALDASLDAIPEPARSDGASVGAQVADYILAVRASDGFAFASFPYPPGTAPNEWRPTPPAFAPALLPGWAA